MNAIVGYGSINANFNYLQPQQQEHEQVPVPVQVVNFDTGIQSELVLYVLGPTKVKIPRLH
jgi:hypothetical protein